MRYLLPVGLVVGVALFNPTGVGADGTLPPQPYHYLHPPPSLARDNLLPISTRVGVAVRSGRADAAYAFTPDGQAGISADPGGFKASSKDTGVWLDIRPVETPPGFPGGKVDGNAYLYAAVHRPGGTAARLTRPARIVLRWPHLPRAMFVYDGSRWQRVCRTTEAGWTITPVTVICQTTSLGTFALTASAAAASVRETAPTSSSGQSNLYVFLLGGVAALIVLAALVYFVLRRRKYT